ncbi:MAG: 1-acyl-sn-glycerol-3-phosphate acyltransferase [Christensenellales bacterium]
MKRLSNALNTCFYYFIKIILYPYFFLIQNVRFKKNGHKIPKSPALFIGNHVTNWDGIYVNVMFFNRKIHFIVHDEMFKNPFFSFISGKILGEIKRSDKINDFSAIRETIRYKNEGKDIGIYPEGDIDMFGRLLHIDDSIGKFAKTLKVPVVLLKINGAHLRSPRWAKRPARSRLTYEVARVISREEAAEMTNEELFDTIRDTISYDEAEYQKTARIKTSGFHRAERLEYGLYYCPKCGAFETLKSRKNDVFCTKCGFKAHYNRYCEFESDFPGCPENTRDWDAMARKALSEYLDNTENEVLFEVSDIRYASVPIGVFFRKFSENTGTLKIFRDKLTFQSETEQFELKYSDFVKNRLQYKSTLEIYTADRKYRFEKVGTPYWSAYQYSTAITYIRYADKVKAASD